MPAGSYNVSRLIRELGFKNVAEMPVRESIQPVIPLGSMAGQVPVHVGSVAVFGGQTTAVAGQRSSFQLQCLDPGGGILMGLSEVTTNIFMLARLATAPLVWATGPTTLPPQQFNNEIPTASVAELGNIAATFGLQAPPLFSNWPVPTFAPLFVPRGTFVQAQTEGTNVAARCLFLWCGITATEGGE